MGALDGRVAVVTGAGRGLGRALCRRLAAHGARVVVSSRQAEAVSAVEKELSDAGFQALGVPCDVTRRGEVDALAAETLTRYGRIDIWVNNAGASAPYGPTRDIDESAFMSATSTIIWGTYFGSMTALRHLPRPGGVLVNLVGRGETSPVPFQTAYASGKSWVRNFTLALATEERPGGLGVIAFQPGLMDTRLVMEPGVLRAYEKQMGALAVVARLWGDAPDVAAERLVRAIAHGERGHVSAHPWWWMLAGPARILLGRRPSLTVRPVIDASSGAPRT
jgi:NAD(P)-dependent dehydrogenase (short-subunit alcohol dehydrogenase family)